MVAGVGVSYTAWISSPVEFQHFPIVIFVGLITIGYTGLMDDVRGMWDPWWKVAGQLVAAAAMAQQGVGTRVAEGFLRGSGFSQEFCDYTLFGSAQYLADPVTVTSVIGTVIIALFILGACNAANLIDGLDGLLSGTVAITCVGLIAISLMIAVSMTPENLSDIENHLPIDSWMHSRGGGISLMGANIVLGLAVLGATVGFLVFNFNPATIFLGDAGSLLLGYLCIVMVLMLGEQGQTHIVVAGLIVFALPILDTLLAIIRRKLAGRPLSEPDSNHIHHIIKRRVVGVKKTVFVLYGISTVFCFLGVTLAWAHIAEEIRALVIYIVAFLIFGGICLLALRAARHHEAS
ncbi:MAG TPA: undecaprenyl/decaprenyl-phosphate alpha-N-acetylglucosaminyl 1-phosphate transferase [Phycisphaerales bacterium]|nr:undecaprenyl/decaprenyl-phosphate alpha-N-acetylglucosaminyl 1-phosphate transferase [Phycisphaerales bacterium]